MKRNHFYLHDSTKYHPFILIVLGIFCFTACEKDSLLVYTAYPVQESSLKLQHQIESLAIPIDSTTADVFEWPQYKQLNGQDFIFSFNSNTYHLKVYERKANRIVSNIQLYEEGPEGLGHIKDFYIHNWDSIFIMSDFFIYIIDSTGYIKQTFDINLAASGSHDFSPLVMSSANEMGRFGIWFEAKEKSIYSYYHPSNIPLNQAEYYDYPIEAAFSLSTQTTTEVAIYYSNLYRQEDAYYGYLNIPLRSVADSLFIYSFPVDPNIYVFNHITKVLSIKGGKSKFIETKALSLSPSENNSEKMMQHIISSPLYFNVLYDPYRQLYYRFQLAPLEFKRPDGKYNGLSDKKASLMVFDSEFQLIEELEMDAYSLQLIFSFVTPEGLWVASNQNDQEDYIEYDIFKFEKQLNK